jgi:hypothetical protein
MANSPSTNLGIDSFAFHHGTCNAAQFRAKKPARTPAKNISFRAQPNAAIDTRVLIRAF